MGNIVSGEKKDQYIEAPEVIDGPDPDGHTPPAGADEEQEDHPSTLLEERLMPFVFRWDRGGSEVYLSGSFNDWETENIMMATNSRGEYTAVVELPEGSHEYKFVVDGQWYHKSDEPAIPNDLGTYNNVVNLQKKHVDAYYEMWDLLTDKADSQTSSLTESYAQDLPPRSATPESPPQIPSVTFKPMIQLNEDMPDLDELPQPNSVVLNDLYALTTRDNILVLTATLRCQMFKEKCFTTLLYKQL